MKTHIDEKWLQAELWQRVVDGEVDRAELAQLVSACDQHPELWKFCAVAFLEEQTLRQELKAIATASSPLPAPELEPSHLRLDRVCTKRAEPLAVAHLSWLNHAALAASMLLAFLVGWQASQRFGRDKPEHVAGAIQDSSAVADTSFAQHHSSVTPAAPPGDERLDPSKRGARTTSDEAGNSLATSTADAIELALERPEQFVPLDRSIPKPLADLEQRGWVRIESIEGFVPVRLRDGHTAVVPVQQIDLRPARKAY